MVTSPFTSSARYSSTSPGTCSTVMVSPFLKPAAASPGRVIFTLFKRISAHLPLLASYCSSTFT